MSLTLAKCPACWADLNKETDNDFFCCPYYGSKIAKQANKVVVKTAIRHVEEHINRIENGEDAVKLKKLEIQEKASKYNAQVPDKLERVIKLKNNTVRLFCCLLITFLMFNTLPIQHAYASGTFTDTRFRGKYTTSNIDAILSEYELKDGWYWTTQAGVMQTYHGTKHAGWTWTAVDNKGKTGYEKGWYGCRWDWDVVNASDPNDKGWGECLGLPNS